MTSRLFLTAIAAAAAFSFSAATVSADDNTGSSRSGASIAKAKSKAPTCDDCYGAINADGTIQLERNIKKVNVIGTGTYEVVFKYIIRYCSFQGTVGETDFVGSPSASMISVTGRVGTNDALFIQTYDSTGAQAERPFHIAIIC